jgi:hypothetical protein
VKRLLALLVGSFGLGALLQSRRRRRALAPPEASAADELRAKLAETRAAVEARDAEPEQPAEAGFDPQSRRRDVHERARRQLDELA